MSSQFDSPTAGDNLQRLLASAQVAISNGQFSQLLDIGREVGFVAPTLGVGSLLVGLAQSGLHDLPAARAAFQHAVRIEPGNADFMFHLSYVEMNLDLLDSALDGFQKVVRIKPADEKAYVNIGAIHARRGNRSKAMEWFQRAALVNPRNFSAWNSIAEISLAEGDFHETIRAADGAMQIEPRNPSVHYTKGLALELVGQADQAIGCFEAAAEIDAKYYAPMFKLATMYAQKDDYSRAQQWATAAKAIAPEDPHVLMAEAIAFKLPLPAMPDEVVKGIFNAYASAYDKHLNAGLLFRAPSLVMEMAKRWIDKNDIKSSAIEVLDIGCGTGLFGEKIKPYASRLIGVDLAQNMLDVAKERHIYDELVCCELGSYLESGARASIDLISATDVIIYVGALESLFQSVSQVLRTSGRFVFTVETTVGDGESFLLKPTGRYQYSIAYVERTALASGLRVDELVHADLRVEAGVAVKGAVFSLCAAG